MAQQQYNYTDAQGRAVNYFGTQEAANTYASQQGWKPRGEQQMQITAITPEKLAPVVPIEQPQQNVPTIPNTQNLASEILKQTEVAPTEAQQFQENTIQNIVKNMGLLQGEAADTANALQQAGVTNLKQDLQGINSQILKKQAEIAQDDIQLISQMRAEERRDTLLPFAQMGQAKLAGDAQIVRALKTSEIGVLNALAIGKQGDIQLAKETAQEAVNAKYAPYKQQIELGKAYLEAIQPLLSRDEKKQAREQELRANLAMKEIDKAETNEKEAKNLAFILQQNGAPQSLINSALKASSVQDIQKIPGVSNYLMSKADRLEIELKRAQLNKITSELAITAAEKGVSAKDLPLIVKSAGDKISKIQGLIDNKKGLTSSSGIIKRGTGLSSSIRDWRADIKNVLSDLTVDELGRVKASGVTFGALSEGERKAVGDAASALNSAASIDKEGRLTGYFNISEDKVRKELQTIQDYTKIDFERRTGMSYDAYVASQNTPTTEESYASLLLNSPVGSPFNIFE